MLFRAQVGGPSAGDGADGEGRTCNICDDPLTGPPLRFAHRDRNGSPYVPPCTTVDACASCWRTNMRVNGYAKCLGLGCTLTISTPSLRALEFVGEERNALLRRAGHAPGPVVTVYQCPQPRCNKSVHARAHSTRSTYLQRWFAMSMADRIPFFLLNLLFILMINILALSENEQGKNVPNTYVVVLTMVIAAVIGIGIVVTPIRAIPRLAMQRFCSDGHTYPVPAQWTDSECFIAFTTRPCPHCHARVERNGGCPSMRCRCGWYFRWGEER